MSEFEARAQAIADDMKRKRKDPEIERFPWEVFFDVGGWTFVLTPKKDRADTWSTKVGHVGITPFEIAQLSKAVGGAVPHKMLLKIAAVKRTFPGATVMRAVGYKEEDQNEDARG